MTERAVDRLVRTARANLRRRFARQPVAVAVSGGGSQGSFETGALRYLYDELNVRPSIICGSSVGAVIAAKLAEGDDPETGRRAIDELAAIWRGLRVNEDMWLAEPWLEKLRAHGAWASALRERAGERGTAGSQTRVVLRMLGEMVRHPPEADGTLDALRQALRAKSLLSMDPVRTIVESQIDVGRIERSGIALRIGAVSLESGVLRYITETGAMCARDGTPLDVEPVPLHEAVLASASIPVMFPPTELAGEHYVDGGAREILPLELAIANLGARHVFAVVASTPGVEPFDDIGDRGLLDIARRVASDIGPDETLRKEMHPPRGWGRRVTLIAPELDVHDAFTIDPVLIGASIDYGYMRAADILLKLDPEVARLSAEIARCRMRIREAEGPVIGFDSSPPDEPRNADVAAEIIDLQMARLSEFVATRRAADAPLPPGKCERVPLASFDDDEPDVASVSEPPAGASPDERPSPRPDPS